MDIHVPLSSLLNENGHGAVLILISFISYFQIFRQLVRTI